MIEIIYQDEDILVCVKPPRVLSTDEPGGLPELIRQQLGDPKACVRTVHRLDRVVGGLMVLARTKTAASNLSEQIRQSQFQKEYLAVVHGVPQPSDGVMTDWLHRDKRERKTYVAPETEPEAQLAILDYRTMASCGGFSEVHIRLQTGRTHQIRAQFSSRDLPLVGDRKYTPHPEQDDGCEIALWSYRLCFAHPRTGKPMDFTLQPPDTEPWL